MKKYIILTLLLISTLLSACKVSDAAIQEAIAQTEAAKPAAEVTAQPSNTPSPTDTPEPTMTPTNTVTPSPTFTATPSPEEKIIGKWSGAMTNHNGDKIPAFWTFMDGGVMIVEITGIGYSYGADWYFDGNRLNITTELDPDDPTYRDVEFVTDDVMILTKDEAEIKETWTRVTEE